MGYKHETDTLLKALVKHGLTPTDAHYSYDQEEKLEATYEDMSNVEDACLYVRFGKGDDAPQTWLRLIYGNDPGELVSDYAIPRSEQFNATLEAALDEYYAMFD